MAAETNKTEKTELRNWPVFFTLSERNRILKRADRNRRKPEQEILAMLESMEELEADITPEIQVKVDTVQNKKLRVTEPEA